MSDLPLFHTRNLRTLWATVLLVIIATAITAVLCVQLASSLSETWFSGLLKPPFMPPQAMFVPVWFVLFALMIAGIILVRLETGYFEPASPAFGLYFTQLGAVIFWALCFFWYREVDAAMGVLCALWILILTMMHAFAGHSRLAALLQLPYLIWITFMLYLNLSLGLAN